MRTLYDQLSDTCAKFDTPSEYLAVDEVIVLFKGIVTFKQYIPKRHKLSGIKTYEFHDMTGYMYNMNVYLGKDRQNVTQMMTATHGTIRS
jgi:hypothetical protein